MLAVFRQDQLLTRTVRSVEAYGIVSQSTALLRGVSNCAPSSSLANLGRLLIANRGEIACRVITTAKRLGVPLPGKDKGAIKTGHAIVFTPDRNC